VPFYYLIGPTSTPFEAIVRCLVYDASLWLSKVKDWSSSAS